MAAEWEKASQLEELDLTATDLSKECLLDILPRIPAIRWLSAGQLDGMTDSVMKVSSLCPRKTCHTLILSMLIYTNTSPF